MCRIHRTIVTTVVVILLAGWLAGCESASVLRRQGVAAYQLKNYEVSRVKFEKLIAENPADWQAQWYLGKIFMAEGDPERARMNLEIAYTLRGKGEPLHPETGDIVDDLANAILMQGDRVRCISLCDEAIRNFGKVRDYLRKGDMLVKMGDADAAVVAYLQTAKISNQTDVRPYLRLADLYAQVGARQQAITTLRMAAYISPGDPQVADRVKALGQIPGPTFARPPTE